MAKLTTFKTKRSDGVEGIEHIDPASVVRLSPINEGATYVYTATHAIEVAEPIADVAKKINADRGGK